jgi:hypothetical protein
MAKQYGIKKCVATGNVLGEQIENLMGTNWELTKKEIPPSPHPPQNPKRKKLSPPELSPWQHEIFISKLVCDLFQPHISGLGGGRGGAEREEGWVEFRKILR